MSIAFNNKISNNHVYNEANAKKSMVKNQQLSKFSWICGIYVGYKYLAKMAEEEESDLSRKLHKLRKNFSDKGGKIKKNEKLIIKFCKDFFEICFSFINVDYI